MWLPVWYSESLQMEILEAEEGLPDQLFPSALLRTDPESNTTFSNWQSGDLLGAASSCCQFLAQGASGAEPKEARAWEVRRFQVQLRFAIFLAHISIQDSCSVEAAKGTDRGATTWTCVRVCNRCAVRMWALVIFRAGNLLVVFRRTWRIRPLKSRSPGLEQRICYGESAKSFKKRRCAWPMSLRWGFYHVLSL